MNFKDLYKSSNDSISPRRELIDTIYEKTEKNKPFFLLYFKQISVCAAAVLILMVSISPLLKNTVNPTKNPSKELAKTDEVNEKKGSYKSQSQSTDGEISKSTATDTQDKNSDVASFDLVQKNDNLPTKEKNKTAHNNKKITNTYPDNSNTKISHSKPDPTLKPNSSEDSVEENLAKENEFTVTKKTAEIPPSEKADTSETAKEPVDDVQSEPLRSTAPQYGSDDVKAFSNKNSSDSYANSAFVSESSDDVAVASGSSGMVANRGAVGGGGGSASSNLSTVTVTTDEYFDYLGIDMKRIYSSVPSGMVFHFPKEIVMTKDNKNNYKIDYTGFVALDNDNPDKVLTVYTSKLGGDAKTAFKSHKHDITVINNIPVAISNNNSHNEAQFVFNGVWFSVSSANISVDEFYDYVSSLIK